MEYCSGKGLPHSSLLSWSRDDRDKLLAYLVFSSTRCPGCGTNPSEWLDAEGMRIEPAPYHAQALHCYGCEAKAKEEKQTPTDEVGYWVRLVRP